MVPHTPTLLPTPAVEARAASRTWMAAGAGREALSCHSYRRSAIAQGAFPAKAERTGQGQNEGLGRLMVSFGVANPLKSTDNLGT